MCIRDRFVYWESGYVWYIEIDGCEDYTSEEIADLIEMEYPCYGPVSYTHLDVYKRQAHST